MLLECILRAGVVSKNCSDSLCIFIGKKQTLVCVQVSEISLSLRKISRGKCLCSSNHLDIETFLHI